MSFPEKGDEEGVDGDNERERGEIQARFQFPISASQKRGKRENESATIPRIIRISKKAASLSLRRRQLRSLARSPL